MLYAIPEEETFGVAVMEADRKELVMNIEWKYKIDLVDNALSEMASKYQIVIPEDLKSLLKIANAATPSKTRFMFKVDEKILGAILSFNPDEKEADSFESAMQIGFDKNIIPFGIDPFGNYICYNTNDNSIVFFDHEEDSTETVASSLEDFLKMLY